jgi:hypothetical protein
MNWNINFVLSSLVVPSLGRFDVNVFSSIDVPSVGKLVIGASSITIPSLGKLVIGDCVFHEKRVVQVQCSNEDGYWMTSFGTNSLI